MQETTINQEEEKRLIQGAYRKLLKSIKSDMDSTDRKNIRMAYELAVEAHSKQRRKSGEPYILHPIEVARICAEEIGLGPTAIVSALLHDVVEDTDVTLEVITKKFGGKIGMIVNGLTKLDGLYNVLSPQAENFKKVLRTLVEDVRVILIKMADRLHNMRTLGSMPRHKQLKIAAETSYIYSPLAHRLGLYNIKTEFQDLCMKITDPQTYHSIAKKLAETKQERSDYIDEFITPLTEELTEVNHHYRITGRPKSIYSIWNKIKTKQVPFEEIYDLFAVRIIVSCPLKKEKQICWQIYSIVTDVHKPIPERLKDWITTPKSNGYESLHTTVVGPKGRYVEVQIRSERMDDIAERGFAAHWKYKGTASKESRRPNITGERDVYELWLDNIRDILDNPEADAIEFLNDFKTNLFNEEVYVYTPKGDMKILPKGATALDFAFSIHSDIGYHCTAIKVNNKLVPMGYKIQNGDQLSVTTHKNQKPTEGWLKMVVTGKARSKIRSAMKEEQQLQGQLGKEALQRKFRNMKVDFEENVDILTKYFGYKTRFELYFAIATEQVNLLQNLKHFKVEGNKLVENTPEPETNVPKEPVPLIRPRKTPAKTNAKLIINNQSTEQFEYSLAQCCKPVQGDDVFAYTTATAGMKIHRTTCPNATNLMANFGYRIMKAEWANTTNTSFVVELLIIGVDSGRGVIERLSHNISSTLGLDIRSFHIDGNEGYFECRIRILVLNKDQLTIAIRALQNLEGVSSVTRVEE